MEGSMVKLNLETHVHEIHLTGKSRLYGITPTADYSLTYLTGDTNINIYSHSSKKVIKSIPGHSHWILSATSSPDDKYLATGSCDHMIKLWNQSSLKESHSLSGHEKDVWSLSISASNRYLVSGGEDKQVLLWDLASKSLIHSFKGHTAPVYSVKITKDLSTIISGGGDGAIHIWDVKSKSLAHTLIHTGLVRSLHLLNQDQLLLSISGKSLKVWDLNTLTQVQQLNHTDNLISLTTSKDLKYILTGDVMGRVWVWDFDLSQVLWVFSGNRASVKWLQVSHDMKFLAIGEKGLVRVWNLETGQQMEAIVNKGKLDQWENEFDLEKFLEVLG
jgi:WD40 repeat protein